MLRHLFLFLACSISCSTISAQKNLAGLWEGILSLKGKEYKFEILFTIPEKGRFEGKTYIYESERDIVEAKRAENDRIKIQEQSNMNNRNLKPLTEEQKIIKDKNQSELELEAENMQQRTILHQKQLNIKDEDLIEPMIQERNAIKEIDDSIKNKTKIRQAIEAGTNCTKRNS